MTDNSERFTNKEVEIEILRQEINTSILRGKDYLHSVIEFGLCPEFHQLAHGPSLAWTSACVGSTLAEFRETPDSLVEAIIALQNVDGGWSYNQMVPSDADTTLRVIQLFEKVGLDDKRILLIAEKFVLAHQKEDGGFSTYTSRALGQMKYQSAAGWTSSHPCVTALAINHLLDSEAREKAQAFMDKHLDHIGPKSYWWRTPRYVGYEQGLDLDSEIDAHDPVDVALDLLTKANANRRGDSMTRTLTQLQSSGGSFIPNRQFRIPRPNKLLEELTEEEEIVLDQRGVLSTCAAIVALNRQRKLLLAS
jgi:hypothetical protein